MLLQFGMDSHASEFLWQTSKFKSHVTSLKAWLWKENYSKFPETVTPWKLQSSKGTMMSGNVDFWFWWFNATIELPKMNQNV